MNQDRNFIVFLSPLFLGWEFGTGHQRQERVCDHKRSEKEEEREKEKR
jgi:hypothetical protein